MHIKFVIFFHDYPFDDFKPHNRDVWFATIYSKYILVSYQQ